MTETDIECGHTKTTLHARGVNRSRKIITFSHLSSTKTACGCIDPIICVNCVFIIFTFWSVVKLLFDDFFHICDAASKLNWTVHKNSACYQLTTETVNCKIVNKTLQWFQNKRSIHWRCSIKEAAGTFCNIHRKTPAPESLFNKVASHTFSTEPLRVTASAVNVLAKIWK